MFALCSCVIQLFQPVHPSGRYFKNSLIEILKDDFGYKSVYSTPLVTGHEFS
jgi:hypothetical protein